MPSMAITSMSRERDRAACLCRARRHPCRWRVRRPAERCLPAQPDEKLARGGIVLDRGSGSSERPSGRCRVRREVDAAVHLEQPNLAGSYDVLIARVLKAGYFETNLGNAALAPGHGLPLVRRVLRPAQSCSSQRHALGDSFGAGDHGGDAAGEHGHQALPLHARHGAVPCRQLCLLTSAGRASRTGGGPPPGAGRALRGARGQGGWSGGGSPLWPWQNRPADRPQKVAAAP